jgi:hypothetical protein
MLSDEQLTGLQVMPNFDFSIAQKRDKCALSSTSNSHNCDDNVMFPATRKLASDRILVVRLLREGNILAALFDLGRLFLMLKLIQSPKALRFGWPSRGKTRILSRWLSPVEISIAI